MCFAPAASFIASAALGATGAVTVTKVTDRRWLPLALVPLLFGIQQAMEGLVWLVLLVRIDLPVEVPAMAFLFFAYIVWPAGLPWAIYLVEPKPERKTILAFLGGIGLVVAAAMAAITTSQSISPTIISDSIDYHIAIPFSGLALTLYVLSTVGSALVSSRRVLNLLAILVLASLLIAQWFFTATQTSVWCFFAAVISLGLAVYVLRVQRRGGEMSSREH